LLGRALYRGGRYLAGSFARSVASRAAGAAVHSVGGLVQNAIRRRRRARAWRTMKAYRQSAALGLGRTRYLCSVKCPFDYLRWGANDRISSVLRVCPLYYGNYGNGWQYANNIFKSDDRFRAMCGLYKQFRILNMYVMLSVSGATQSFGDIGMFARIIRNGKISTPFSDFISTHSVVCVPGVIWKRETDQDRRLSLALNIAPKSILEKSQWYSTDYDSSPNSLDFVNGVDMDFCPMVDFAVYGRSAPTGDSLVPIEMWIRLSIEFRDATDGSDERKVVTMDLGEPAKKEVKVSEVVEP
jgi:hypothetical protein